MLKFGLFRASCKLTRFLTSLKTQMAPFFITVLYWASRKSTVCNKTLRLGLNQKLSCAFSWHMALWHVAHTKWPSVNNLCHPKQQRTMRETSWFPLCYPPHKRSQWACEILPQTPRNKESNWYLHSKWHHMCGLWCPTNPPTIPSLDRACTVFYRVLNLWIQSPWGK